ncbi:MAG: hypothetical protein EP305_02125 [Bacteroidetes bacterium]|nr:MAG: hypothetical protein EP305_02125 [Bacteroidota bacterium]
MRSDHAFEFHSFNTEKLSSLFTIREGEERIGQRVKINANDPSVKYVILGISESIGPQSNLGRPGSENGFHSFLIRFLSMQSNQFLNGSEICIAGEIQQNTKFKSADQGAQIVQELDSLVLDVLQDLLTKDQCLIVIGGGHNNAYPIIAHFAKNKRINVVNLDPHADCRKTDRRHSGNPFSHAIEFGHIEKYHAIGLHKAYNNQFILDFLKDNHCHYSFLDDYILNRGLLLQDISSLSTSMDIDFKLGVELDMDSIAFMPTSAFTPAGISMDEARFYVKTFASLHQTCYLHLPEAAPNNPNEEMITGKALAYLVYDFITTNLLSQP